MTKVNRSAFLYFAPEAPVATFAQCATCRFWTGEHSRRCALHGPVVVVDGDDTCGLYVHGAPDPKQRVHADVTKAESGFEDREVRCEHCRFFVPVGAACGLFARLNRALPDRFDLDVHVNRHGCCNANTPRRLESSARSR